MSKAGAGIGTVELKLSTGLALTIKAYFFSSLSRDNTIPGLLKPTNQSINVIYVCINILSLYYAILATNLYC